MIRPMPIIAFSSLYWAIMIIGQLKTCHFIASLWVRTQDHQLTSHTNKHTANSHWLTQTSGSVSHAKLCCTKATMANWLITHSFQIGCCTPWLLYSQDEANHRLCNPNPCRKKVSNHSCHAVQWTLLWQLGCCV